MFQKKLDELFSCMSNLFGITDEILVAGLGLDLLGRDDDEMLEEVPWVCRQASLKLNKDQFLFRCTSIPFFGQIILWKGVSPDPRNVQALTDMPPPKMMKEFQSFLGMLKCLSKFLPMTAEVCAPLQS